MALALATACALAAFHAQPAAAQTAKKLNCNGCVKSKQLKNNGIKSTDIKNGQVKNDDLGNNAVTGGKIADGTVSNADLANDAVDGAKVLNGSLTGADIQDGSLSATDLGDGAGADGVGGDGFTILSGSMIVDLVETVTITAPSDGVVIANASGTFEFPMAPGTVRCALSMDPFVGPDSVRAVGAADDPEHLSMTKFFVVPAGDNTFNLNCIEDSGNVVLADTHLTAMFFPKRY